MNIFTKTLSALILSSVSATALAGCVSSPKSQVLPQIDMTAWNYNEDDDVYYQLGIQYVANPADTTYETLGAETTDFQQESQTLRLQSAMCVTTRICFPEIRSVSLVTECQVAALRVRF